MKNGTSLTKLFRQHPRWRSHSALSTGQRYRSACAPLGLSDGAPPFDVCSETDSGKPYFAVSLGAGASGYSPTLDCTNSIIAVGRQTSSILLIDAYKARENWVALGSFSPLDVISLFGVNQRSIWQPFYLGNPEGLTMPNHSGLALVPGISQDLQVAVGFMHGTDASGIKRGGQFMRGLPSSLHPLGQTQMPFLPEPPNAPVVDSTPDQRAWPGPQSIGNVSRVTMLHGLEVYPIAIRIACWTCHGLIPA